MFNTMVWTLNSPNLDNLSLTLTPFLHPLFTSPPLPPLAPHLDSYLFLPPSTPVPSFPLPEQSAALQTGLIPSLYLVSVPTICLSPTSIWRSLFLHSALLFSIIFPLPQRNSFIQRLKLHPGILSQWTFFTSLNLSVHWCLIIHCHHTRAESCSIPITPCTKTFLLTPLSIFTPFIPSDCSLFVYCIQICCQITFKELAWEWCYEW